MSNISSGLLMSPFGVVPKCSQFDTAKKLGVDDTLRIFEKIFKNIPSGPIYQFIWEVTDGSFEQCHIIYSAR